MNGNCFEMGTIQAFLDGETGPEVSLRLTDHIAACDRCATALAEAEEETSVVFATLDREMNTLVPTQRLWSRINETITEEKSRASLWQKLLAFASVYLANPSFAVAAGLVIVAGLFVAIWNPQINVPTERIARNNSPVAPHTGPAGVRTGNPVAPAPAPTGIEPTDVESAKDSDQIKESKLPAKELNALFVNAGYKSSEPRIRPEKIDIRTPVVPATAVYLPGEESYVKTIAELRQNVDGQKDTVLPPSSRVSYERNMAVVNDSIQKMREVVRKNPRNQAAKQVLYSSYQDKIDLLNSVAQREDLVASLR